MERVGKTTEGYIGEHPQRRGQGARKKEHVLQGTYLYGFCADGAILARCIQCVSAECLCYEWRGPHPWASVCLPTWGEEMPFPHYLKVSLKSKLHICLNVTICIYITRQANLSCGPPWALRLGCFLYSPFLHFLCLEYLSCLSLIDT